MQDYKNNFKKLCLQINSLEHQRNNTFDFDIRKQCDAKIKLIKYSIDNLLDDYSNANKQEILK